jgi:hypothetical protein
VKFTRPAVAALAAASLISSGLYLLQADRLFRLGLPLDDAWIHQTYARNLVERGEWAFQVGEPSAGSTSPLWGAVLAAGRLLPIPPLVWTYLVGCALLSLTALEVARWIGRRQPLARWAVAAGLLASLEWHLAWASVSGMEILAGGLLALIVLQLSERGRVRPFWVGLLIGVGAWIRPEGLLLALPVGWTMAWGARRRPARMSGPAQRSELGAEPAGPEPAPARPAAREPDPGSSGRALSRRVAAASAGLALSLLGYGLFNWLLSGHWLPNTWYAKSAEYAVLRQVPLLVRLAGQLGLPGETLGYPELAAGGPLVGPLAVLLPGLAVAAASRLRRDGPAGLGPLIWVLAHLGAYALRLPATYQHGRYAMPVIPLLLALSGEGLVEWCGAGLGRRVIARAWPLSAALLTLAFWVAGSRAYARDVAIIESEMVAAAQWVAANTPRSALIAAHDIGALGYFGERAILDLAGLVSPEVIPILRDQAALAELLDRRQAEFLMTFPGWYPQLVQHLQPIYATGGRFSPAAGGENMAVYRWSAPVIAP